jgi:hypothetical protein
MIALVIAAAVLGASVQETGSIIPQRGAPARPDGSRDDSAHAQRVMSDFARCVVMRNRRGVERFLGIIPGSSDWAAAGSRIATPNCLHNAQLRFQPSIFRGALYEALYRVEYAARPVPELATAPEIDYAAADPTSLNEIQRSWVALQSFGDCVVRASGSNARSLVVSDAGSPAERNAFAAITPALGPCLPQGVQLAFSRPILRGLVAESLYRLTAASAAAASRQRPAPAVEAGE